ncbi:MAG TPA: serine hydrolase domain-containing protein, partial [Vicinamibacteria bacterium]|nr:serine hydrolase domain-containing protein [Vicinamibacteria bacterium]
REMTRQHIPGLTLGVVRDGHLVRAEGYGLANVELDAPATPRTMFQSGSVGKQFTAALVLLLAADGRLGLDDPVAKRLPEAPAAWKGITIRHLLTHTSGIAEYTDRIDLRRDYTEDQLLRMAGERPLDFAPGARWSYSNTAYAVLGVLIHRASGRFYGDLLRERIFEPLGMTTARIISEADVVPGRAAGYRRVDGQLKNQEWVAPSLNTTADGALYLSAIDMARWAEGLETDVPLPLVLRTQMWTRARLADGTPAAARDAGYGFGWFLTTRAGQPVTEHGGSWQGFQSYIGRFPDQKLTVYAFSNLAGSDPGIIARAVAALYAPVLASASPSPAP